jgi:hypothetical protein
MTGAFGLGLEQLRDQVWSAHAQIAQTLQIHGPARSTHRFTGVKISNGQSRVAALALALLLSATLLCILLVACVSRLLVIAIAVLVSIAPLALLLAVHAMLTVTLRRSISPLGPLAPCVVGGFGSASLRSLTTSIPAPFRVACWGWQMEQEQLPFLLVLLAQARSPPVR